MRVGVIGALDRVNGGAQIAALIEVLRVAIPLMISTGLFSVTLFVDRTFLLWYDGTSMGAAMAAGNVFWVSICGPIGIVSMSGAIIAQYVGAGQSDRVGRFLWQTVWMSLAFLPIMAAVAYLGPDLFRWTGQDPELWAAESTYLRLLAIGGFGAVLENGLSGFFSGTHRTAVILWASLISAVVNIVLDAVLIFGVGSLIAAGGITGAAIATVISIYVKAVVYAAILLFSKSIRREYQTSFWPNWDSAMFKKLLFFGFPTGLMYITESGAFTVIVLQIGKLGDIPLRATTMAINFNMVAFIPLVGVSVAASVLVGQKLTQSDRARNQRLPAIDSIQSDSSVAVPTGIEFPLPPDLTVSLIARASIAVAWVYSIFWCCCITSWPSGW